MTTPALIGILLFILGLAAFTYTTHEKGFDLDLIQVTEEERGAAPLPPVVGVGALMGGFLLLRQGRIMSGPPRP